MKQASPPVLQKPGAGLPLSQMIFIKAWLGPVVSRRTPPKTSREHYERVTGKLIDLVAKTPEASRAKRVLIAPMAGLEDSSRYWSLNEVLEHLLIVSTAMEGAILELSAGRVPKGEADTAKVKPSGANRDLLSEFRAFAPELMKRLDEKLAQPGLSLDSPTLFRHPWFGPINARQWYWLLGTHHGLHYRQAKAIAAGLASE